MSPVMFVVRLRGASLVGGIRRGREVSTICTTRFADILEREWGRSKRKYCGNSSWNINLKGGIVNDSTMKGCRSLSFDTFHWAGGANNRVRAGEMVI